MGTINTPLKMNIIRGNISFENKILRKEIIKDDH